MNIEVEIKIKIDNLDEIKQKLSKIGKLVKSINQIDEYYVPAHRDFFARKPYTNEWLRIRNNSDKVIFEYDRSINQAEDGSQEYAEEYETEVSHSENLKKILEFLDFKKSVTVDKKREYWMCGDIEVALDEVKDLGFFIEAEAKGDFKDALEARIACAKFLEDLGIKDVEKNQINLGYPNLILNSK
ncbi:MAG: class IV adenylate cyclase [Candidatus Staskawiczbacteria bacterium]|jgi:adenylate cyclase class 2